MHRAPCQHRVHTNKKKNPNLYGRKQKCATAHRRQLDMFDGLCVRMQCVCDGVRYRGFKFFGQRLRNACASAHVEMAVCRVPMHVFAGHITIFFLFFSRFMKCYLPFCQTNSDLLFVSPMWTSHRPLFGYFMIFCCCWYFHIEEAVFYFELFWHCVEVRQIHGDGDIYICKYE